MKIHILPFIALFIFIGTTINAQNVYSNDSDRVVTKVLGTDSIHSNLPLEESLSKIPSFSRQLQIFQLTDFENLIEQHQMVTVFIVKNNAFDFMDEEELEQFFSSSNKNKLTEMQNYYIIPGRVDENSIKRAVLDGDGAASFRTINNKTIRFIAEGETVYLTTESGSKSRLLETNLYHSKGLFHVTDKLPIQKK